MRIIAALLCLFLLACTSQTDTLRKNFENPPDEFRPMPFWHLNGSLTKDGVERQITDAKNLSGFGGITVLPVTAGPHFNTGALCPGTEPTFLSNEFFDRYIDMLNISQKLGMEIILYDDVDFPSGSAGGRLYKEFPQYSRKYLIKEEFMVQGGTRFEKEYIPDSTNVLMAVSAMNTATLEVLDLQPFIKENILEWDVPKGEWRVMFFNCKYNIGGVHQYHVDYMQPEAVSKVMEMTYGEYDKRFGQYFGNVIKKTFFDDVGFVHSENTWTPAITEIFKQKYGKNPALYYPALFYDIGAETQSARVAFYDIRSELMAEGYVKQVSEWSAKRNLKSMGHPPENYSPNSVVANGDILKYYRHAQIPLLDAIFFYGRGLNGFKQISSAADLGDKPIVGAELCGAFPADMDSLTLYRVVMESMARGVNFVVPHGMWYDTDPAKVRIPPLISPENPLLRDCLPNYSIYTARSCMMLQGGRRISDIALLWPISSVQGGSYINRDAKSGLPVANWVPEHVNHYQLSDIFTNQIHRDFTYIHPEDLVNGKVTANASELVLNNEINKQHFKVLVMPGGDVISVPTLQAIKAYYEGGGKIIATASLPFLAAEFGRDKEVQDIISELFGVEPQVIPENDIIKENQQGGQLAFIRNTDKISLEKALNALNIMADIQINTNFAEESNIGYVNYIHKNKDGKDIYFFTNTTENPLSAQISLRGQFDEVEIWNPHTGDIAKVPEIEKNMQSDGTFRTDLKVSLPAVSSIFIIGLE